MNRLFEIRDDGYEIVELELDEWFAVEGKGKAPFVYYITDKGWFIYKRFIFATGTYNNVEYLDNLIEI